MAPGKEWTKNSRFLISEAGRPRAQNVSTEAPSPAKSFLPFLLQGELAGPSRPPGEPRLSSSPDLGPWRLFFSGGPSRTARPSASGGGPRPHCALALVRAAVGLIERRRRRDLRGLFVHTAPAIRTQRAAAAPSAAGESVRPSVLRSTPGARRGPCSPRRHAPGHGGERGVHGLAGCLGAAELQAVRRGPRAGRGTRAKGAGWLAGRVDGWMRCTAGKAPNSLRTRPWSNRPGRAGLRSSPRERVVGGRLGRRFPPCGPPQARKRKMGRQYF